MVIQVGDQIEQELRRLAGHQGRALADVVEAALRSYIEAEAITDIESTDIAYCLPRFRLAERRGCPARQWSTQTTF